MKTLKKIGITIFVAIALVPYSLWCGLKVFWKEFAHTVKGNVEDIAIVWKYKPLENS